MPETEPDTVQAALFEHLPEIPLQPLPEGEPEHRPDGELARSPGSLLESGALSANHYSETSRLDEGRAAIELNLKLSGDV